MGETVVPTPPEKFLGEIKEAKTPSDMIKLKDATDLRASQRENPLLEALGTVKQVDSDEGQEALAALLWAIHESDLEKSILDEKLFSLYAYDTTEVGAKRIILDANSIVDGQKRQAFIKWALEVRDKKMQEQDMAAQASAKK
jgi:hypothetical protein